MLLQSHTGVIEVFPAIPEAWKETSFATLRAQGGFLVSAQRNGGKTTQIEIYAEQGGPCRLRLPGQDTPFEQVMMSGQHLTATLRTDGHYEIR